MAQIKFPKIGGDDACPQDSVTNIMSANYSRLFSWLVANRHYNKRSAGGGGGDFLSWHMCVAGQETVQSKGLIERFGPKSGRGREEKLRRLTHWFELRTSEPQPDLDSKSQSVEMCFSGLKACDHMKPSFEGYGSCSDVGPAGCCRGVQACEKRQEGWLSAEPSLLSQLHPSELSVRASSLWSGVYMSVLRLCVWVCVRLCVSTPYASKPRSAFIFKPYRWTNAGGDAGDSLEPHSFIYMSQTRETCHLL